MHWLPMQPRRALLSVWDKRGITEFAAALAELGVELIASEGTGATLRAAGIPVRSLGELLGATELLDGRVKTLHPLLHAAILARRDRPEHLQQLEQLGIAPIELVVVNFYPFQAMERSGAALPELLEFIDIGGPALVRAAAKNYPWVAVVTSPRQYEEVIAELRQHGSLSEELRRRYAAEAFALTAAYDAAIARALSTEPFPPQWSVSLPQVQRLRYGENPHQQGCLYGDAFGELFEQLHGKELSYNNVLDLDAAVRLIRDFPEPTVAILKHTTPCGVGSAAALEHAWEKALATDPVSAFGGIVVTNRAVTRALAERLSELFLELIVAPEFAEDALEVLQRKRNLRLLRYRAELLARADALEFRSILGGALVQSPDIAVLPPEGWRVVTHRAPTEQEAAALEFAWRVVKHAKSNAVVFAAPDRTLAIGCGQPSRVDAVRVAIRKAADVGISLEGSVIASDAFFPFPDALQEAIHAGITAAVQPGGSVRDALVIETANAAGIAMVFTGMRHFRH
jgi:phosphoribosylaminoimidazolecarboxamide formyltransferase/IMP cyclohydrolase